ALGAKRRDIHVQVLVESATLSLLGALIGIGVGVVLAQIVQALSPLPAAIAPVWMAISVLMGMGVGVIAGIYPAARAARLDPVVALRAEETMRIESLREGAVLAIDQLRANKFRSGLTILGIVVGVATVMAMSALIQGIQSSIVDEMEAVGPKNFMIARYNFNSVQISNNGPPWGSNPAVTVQEARRIAQLPTMRQAM